MQVAGGMKEWLIRAQQPRSRRISLIGEGAQGPFTTNEHSLPLT